MIRQNVSGICRYDMKKMVSKFFPQWNRKSIRSNEHDRIMKGAEFVSMVEDSLKRRECKMGQVIQIFKSSDGVCNQRESKWHMANSIDR